MSLFDGMNMAEQAMSVHRYRTEIAAQNIVNVFTPGYRFKRVQLREGNFSANLANARTARLGGPRGGQIDAKEGAIRVAGVREVYSRPGDYRAQALNESVELMQSKQAY